MTKTDLLKSVSSFVVATTTGTVVKEIIKNNIDPQTVAAKAACLIASYVLGAIAADAGKKWTDAKIDELIAEIKEARQKITK